MMRQGIKGGSVIRVALMQSYYLLHTSFYCVRFFQRRAQYQ